jgi:hypothetical protein
MNNLFIAKKEFKYNHTSGLKFLINEGDEAKLFSKGKTVALDIIKSKDIEAEGHRIYLSNEEFEDRFDIKEL